MNRGQSSGRAERAPPGTGALPRVKRRQPASQAARKPRVTGSVSPCSRRHCCGQKAATATQPPATTTLPGGHHVTDTEADPPPAERLRLARHSDDGSRVLPVKHFLIKVQTLFRHTHTLRTTVQCKRNVHTRWETNTLVRLA